MLKYISILFLLGITACVQSNRLQKVEIKYPNGQLKIQGTILNGQKHGLSRTFYANGQIQTKNNWENGQQVGKSEKWFENGYKNAAGQMANGNQEGEWKYYNDLDGKYIYSVFYKNGVFVDYKFSDNKYNWRTVNIEKLAFTVELPSPIFDSTHITNGVIGYWTLYPWVTKKDIEYYGLIHTSFQVDKEALKENIAHFGSNPQNDMNLLLSSGINDTPNLVEDKYQVVEHKPINLGAYEAFVIEIYFPELKVTFKSYYIPNKNGLQLVFGYFNELVSEENKNRFFESIKFK